MPLNLRNLKPYVPAKDFELSKQFYKRLGFTMSEGWGGTADFALDGFGFRPQNYYARAWAENFMFVIDVDDIRAWYERALELLDSQDFPGMWVQAPEAVEGYNVLHVTDPSGVLLVFVH